MSQIVIDADTGSFITVSTAEDWVETFRTDHVSSSKGHFFGMNKLQQLLDLDNCMGVIFYHAVDDQGDRTLVAVAVDNGNQELYHTNGNDDLALDGSVPCPMKCPAGSISEKEGISPD